MKKLITAAAAALALAVAGPAFAGNLLFSVKDPTPNGMFSGQYQSGTDGNGQPTYGTQTGYVGVYDDGVVVCNGSPDTLKHPVTGSPLQGFIWVGSGEQSTGSTTAADPTRNVGAGNNHKDANSAPTGKSPCASQTGA